MVAFLVLTLFLILISRTNVRKGQVAELKSEMRKLKHGSERLELLELRKRQEKIFATAVVIVILLICLYFG